MTCGDRLEQIVLGGDIWLNIGIGGDRWGRVGKYCNMLGHIVTDGDRLFNVGGDSVLVGLDWSSVKIHRVLVLKNLL